MSERHALPVYKLDLFLWESRQQVNVDIEIPGNPTELVLQTVTYAVQVFICAHTKMLLESPCLRLLQRCREKLNDLGSRPDPSLRVIVGHSNMLDRLIGTLDVDHSSYPSHYITCSRSENDAAAPEVEYDDALSQSSESDIDMDTDSDDDYDYFTDRKVLSVRNPDPPGDNTCFSEIDMEPPIARFEEASTSSESLNHGAARKMVSLNSAVSPSPQTDCQKQGRVPQEVVWWRDINSFRRIYLGHAAKSASNSYLFPFMST
jgi:hypothetical protein